MVDRKQNKKENGNHEGQEKIARKQSELMLSTTAFLGGITFAAMVFVMQAQEQFIFQNISYYPDILITFLAGISFTFILSSLGNMDVAAGILPAFGDMAKYSLRMAVAAWISVLVIIPFLVLPFTLIGAFIVGMLEAIVAVRYITHTGQV